MQMCSHRLSMLWIIVKSLVFVHVQVYMMMMQCVNVQVHVKQEKTSRNLLGKLDRKLPTLPDIEDCGKYPEFCSLTRSYIIFKGLALLPPVNSETCPLCPSQPWDDELGVQNFPRKPAKKPPRVERTLTCVVIRAGEEGGDEYLLTQRPDTGQGSPQAFPPPLGDLFGEDLAWIVIYLFILLLESLRKWWMWAADHSSTHQVDVNHSSAVTLLYGWREESVITWTSSSVT